MIFKKSEEHLKRKVRKTSKPKQVGTKDAARETDFAVPFPRGVISFVRAQFWKILHEILKIVNH